MLLVNFFNGSVDSKKLLKTIKNYKINNLLIINFNFSENVKIISKEDLDHNAELTDKQGENRNYLFKMLDSLKIFYEYIDISANISPLSLIALLTKRIVSYNSLTTIDVSLCPKSFLPLILQSAYYIPALINEIIMQGEEIDPTTVSYPIVTLNFDPDKETHLLKEILTLFLSKQQYYTDLAFNKTLSSTMLLQMINEEQSSIGLKEFTYPYIQACLSTLSQEQKGKTIFLQKRHNSSDKRALVYTITDQGVLTLLIWYLQYKNSGNVLLPLYSKLDEFLDAITFSEIEYQYISHTNSCSICNNQQISELFTCSICGQESCKDCLDDHYLNNKCQVQLQIAS